MAITEQSRYELHRHLIETMGEERAETLMAHLPPVGWADVATKQDIEHLRVATTKDIEHLATRAGLADVRTELHKSLWQHTLFLVGTNITLFGLALGVAKLG